MRVAEEAPGFTEWVRRQRLLREMMSKDRALLALRLLCGGVFIAFGIGKFVNHASELSSFKTYGLPAPAAFVVIIGVVEVVGGALLITGLLTRPAALVLAGDMVGAIIVSGLARGELVSLTVAPAELVAMVMLLWTGPGRYAVGMPSALRESKAIGSPRGGKQHTHRSDPQHRS